MTIYADVLVALNILVTYIIIVAVRVFCKIPTNKWAVMLASLVGGFTSLIIFRDNLSLAYSALYKLFCGVVIVALAFLPKNIRLFVKSLLGFFLVSFLFGGGVYALQITMKPQNILCYNGIVYFDMSISYLVGCVLSVYGVFLMADYIISRKNTRGLKCTLEIEYNNSAVTVPAFADTGNTLVDGLSSRPVIVAELSAVAPILQRDELLFFKNKDFENVPQSLYKRFRFVPCSVVTGEGFLPSFLPDRVKITTENGSLKTDFCTIGVTDKALSQGDYRALLNNNIFENVKEEKANEKIYK